MDQSIKHPTLAQVMILGFMGLSSASGSVLTAHSLEPASDSVSLSLSPSPTHTLSVLLSKINIKKTKQKTKRKQKQNEERAIEPED